MIDFALSYAARGWSILPMRMSAKVPACKWKKYQTKRAGEAQLRKWFAGERDYGIAVVFGKVSGNLASRDFDDMQAYEVWAGEHPELAKQLPTVETRRGRHVYFQADGDQLVELRRRIGKPDGTGAIDCGDGEFRAGVGCYSVLPPSKHPEGHVYRWLIPLPVGELPIVDLLCSGLGPCNREDRENLEDTEDRGGQREQKTWKEGALASQQPTTSCLQSSESSTSSVLSLSSMPSMLQAQIRQAIQRTLPNGHGQRHRQIFELARELKALPTLADAPAKSLRPIVKNWHALAVEKIKTKPLVDTLIDFSEAWGKVKYPKGKGAIDMLFANADQANLPAEMDEYDSDELRQLAALCRELQRAAGEGAFFLDVRTAGRLLGIHHTTAWRYLSFLSDEGIIGVVSKGSAKARRASRYRYLGPL